MSRIPAKTASISDTGVGNGRYMKQLLAVSYTGQPVYGGGLYSHTTLFGLRITSQTRYLGTLALRQ